MAVDRDHIWFTLHNTTESCNSRRLQKPPHLFVVQRFHHMHALRTYEPLFGLPDSLAHNFNRAMRASGNRRRDTAQHKPFKAAAQCFAKSRCNSAGEPAFRAPSMIS